MLSLSEAAAKLVRRIMVEQGLDPERDVFEVTENDEGFAISFTRDLTATHVVAGLRVFYRGSPLAIDVATGGQMGLVFTKQ